MASAYAALVSLMNVIDHIQNHARLSNYIDKKQMESLLQQVSFMLDFVESNHSHGGYTDGAQVLESQIATAAYAAEDVIESHVVGQIHTGSLSLLDLQTVTLDMGAVKDKVATFREERGFISALQTTSAASNSMSATSSVAPTDSRKSEMVGFDEELFQLQEVLAGQRSSLQIIPIVGMGGIGKTTLAKNLYESRLILSHFDFRAWVTISQEYSVREISLKLLSTLINFTDNIDRKTEQELTLLLYQTLHARRYLVILDDMWSIEAWEQIKFSFPDNNNGSRIIVTTRIADLLSPFESSSLVMSLLDEEKSWKLFCQKAFSEEGCPYELEGIGKNIVKKCRGLPLSIDVIGGLLRSRTREYWENISRDISSIIFLNSNEEKYSLDILSLSYCHLPAHLKSCFLYMGIFPEDHEIHVSELIKLWVAEGFLKPDNTQILEEVAKGYLRNLVDRNLILVDRLGWNGKITTCRIHDLLRDLCIKSAQREKFFREMRVSDVPQGIDTERRIVFHYVNPVSHSIDPNDRLRLRVLRALGSSSHTRSLISYGVQLSFNFKLLRVMDLLDMTFDSLDDIFFAQVNLRYFNKLAFREDIEEIHKELPSSISLLWNLQTLILRDGEVTIAPPEIWDMSQLRHLDMSGLTLPNPPLMSDSQNENNRVVLRNLHTLKTVWNLTWSDEVCKRIPNIKKLSIVYNRLPWEKIDDYRLYNIGSLHKLESLSYNYYEFRPERNMLQNLKFPSSVKKLNLRRCRLHWDYFTMIGSLPNLVQLNLLDNSARGQEWNPVKGEFLRLKCLIIDNMELRYWNADSSHFPALEMLFLCVVPNLVEIPSGIGEIPTLQSIEVSIECSESAMFSAVDILQEQESLGNDSLRVRLELMESQAQRLIERFDGFTSTNLVLDIL